MFLDEARLSLRLNHANIVHVFDIGVADNTYFIVMEYVDGTSLKVILETARRRGRPLPIPQAVYITMEICRGLAYAHEMKDHNGTPLNIVHRDISPPNILISKRGEIKLVDFGLAKAQSQLEHTDPGIVKGKFSYLSPEAAAGLEIDKRADIFSTGILLFEMLTNRKLFQGETDYQTVELVRESKIPSMTELNSQISSSLEKIVLRALKRDQNERYQTTHEFGDDLAYFLFSHGLKVTAFDIAALVEDVLREQKKLQAPRPTSLIDRLIQEELLRFTSLDKLEDPLDPGSTPLSPGEISPFSHQPDIGKFEDPRKWAKELIGSEPLIVNEPPQTTKNIRRTSPPSSSQAKKVAKVTRIRLDPLTYVLISIILLLLLIGVLLFFIIGGIEIF
jgi:serine/threonine-protein kinase